MRDHDYNIIGCKNFVQWFLSTTLHVLIQ
jgi:hypothetical protein